MPPKAGPPFSACTACGAPVAEKRAAGLCIGCVLTGLSRSREGSPAGAAAPGSDTPRLPADYELIDTLGRGGMGVVYLVYQRSLTRYAALKMLAAGWTDHPRARERFMREARAAAQLSHPGIVPILDLGTVGETAWYTMEYMEGGDLAGLMAQKGGKLPWLEAAALVAKVAEAIQQAHAMGVAHRDLKPSNILLDAAGEPKVADFGLAWLASSGRSELTLSGEILGTPAYLAPEAVSGGTREIDARSTDIYALGALLFHLVAGRPPFVGEHPMSIIGSIVNEPAPRLRTLAGADVPTGLEAICERCLAKAPAARYGAAGELAAALRGSEMARASWRRPWWGRRAVWAVSGVAAAGVVAGGLYWAVLRRSGSPALRDASAVLPPSLGETTVLAPRIAVLPLEMRTKDASVELLAAGLQDELISTLPRISDLRVLGRQSLKVALSQTADPLEAARRLNVDAALTGSVEKEGEMLRIHVQLVDLKDGTALWSQSYTRRETLALNLETEIATEVARQLNAHLRPRSGRATTVDSTAVPAALKAYIRARSLVADGNASADESRGAASLLETAVLLDPAFARAQAQLSLVHTQLYFWSDDRTEERLERGLRAAQAALRLDPELPEAQLALGLYYFRGSGDYRTAAPLLRRADALAPNNPDTLAALANLERRQGAFADSAVRYDRALALDPLNAVLAYNTADTYLRLRQYETASQILERALAQMPGRVSLVKLKGDLHLAWKGDLRPMAEDLLHRDPTKPKPELYLMDRLNWLTMENRLDEALAALRTSDFPAIKGQAIYLTRRGFEALLLAMSDHRAEAATAASAALTELEQELAKRPNDARVLMHTGQMLALQGKLAEGERLARRTVTPGDVACVDAFDRGHFLRGLALLLALNGEDGKALQVLRQMLQEPNQMSVAYLAHHPILRRYSAQLEVVFEK